MTVEAEAEPLRCFEGEQVTVRITLSYDGEPARLDPGVTLGHGVRLDHLAVGPHRVDLVLTARRWGRWTLGTVEVDVYDPGGSARRTVRAELGDIAVFPLPGHAGLTPIPVRLPQRLVEHTVEQRGEGIEVTGVHRYVRGRRQRRIHRPATTRRGALQVHPFAAERTADTVVLLDVLADVVNPVTDASSLDETFRAAAGLVRAYLRTHDRVGVVSVGGATRWLQPDSGQGYFYRIVESVLEVRKDRAYRTEGLSPLPPPARADPGSPPQDDGAAGGDRGRRSHRPPVWLVVCMAALLPAYLLVTDAWTAGVSAPPDCPRATPALAAAAATAVVLLAAQAPSQPPPGHVCPPHSPSPRPLARFAPISTTPQRPSRRRPPRPPPGPCTTSKEYAAGAPRPTPVI